MKTMTIKIKRDPKFVLKALKENKFMVIDDHNGKEKQLEAAIMLEGGYIVAFLKSRLDYQSLRGLYVNLTTNKVHIRKYTECGTGVIEEKYFDRYNKERKEFEKEFNLKPNKISTVYWKDGKVEKVA